MISRHRRYSYLIIIAFVIGLATEPVMAAPFLFSPARIIHFCKNLLGYGDPKTYKVQNSRVRTNTSTADYYGEWQSTAEAGSSENFHFYAYLQDEGLLRIFARLVDHQNKTRSKIRGKEALDRALRHLGTDRINEIEGQWHASSDNHVSFRNALFAGETPTDAAYKTWTGKLAEELGFTQVRSIHVAERVLTIKGQPVGKAPPPEMNSENPTDLKQFVYFVRFVKPTEAPKLLQLDSPLLAKWYSGGRNLWLTDIFFGYQLGLKFESDQIKLLNGSKYEDDNGVSSVLLSVAELVYGLNYLLDPANEGTERAEKIKAHYRYALESLQRLNRPTTHFDTSGSILLDVLERYRHVIL